MSFGRLLAAGKSLIGLRNGESRYRENKSVRLPKFGAPRNPFASEKPVEVAPDAGDSRGPIPVQGTPEKLEAARIQPSGNSARAAVWLGVLTQKLNPFAPRRAAKPCRNGAAGTARQGELALERVQVMRNDFSDLECEPVRSVPRTLPGLPVMAVTMEKLEPVGAAWSRLTTKFLGSDQT